MILFLVALLATLALRTDAVPIANGVEGDPEIECGPNSITINFNTQNEFEGTVYVKGLIDQEGCRNEDRGRQVAGITLPFDSCNTHRTRSLNPRGVFVTNTVVITFHPKFVTKIDRAYRIQCFYMEADKTVDTNLEVSGLTTLFQTQQVPMPVCRYEILSGGPTGAVVRYATVGEAVFHKWTCESETVDTFCMIVHSCYVDDTNGDRVDLVDANGCSTDFYLLHSPEYMTDLMAGVEAHVFKYADRANLYFQCQVTILIKEPNNECPRPACATPAGRGAGSANPTQGPPPAAPRNPFPLQPGSPYLPGETQIGTGTGGAGGAGGQRPQTTAAPRGTPLTGLPSFPPAPARPRRSVAESENAAGTMDVQFDMDTLEVSDNLTPSDRNRSPLLPRFSTETTEQRKQETGICLSQGTIITFFAVAVAVIVGIIIATTYCVMRKKQK